MKLNDNDHPQGGACEEAPQALRNHGHGLHLLVNPNGSRWWKLKYYFEGVEKLHSLGVYPECLVKARATAARGVALGSFTHGVDPSAEREAAKRARAHTFEAVAREWWDERRPNWSLEYAKAVMTRFRAGRLPRHRLEAREDDYPADFLECLERR